MNSNKKTVVFPTVRFVPDKNDKGNFITDERTGEWKSGTLQVALQRASVNGDSEYVSGYSEQMSFKKFQAVREDIDSLNVEQLKEYFPALKTQEDLEKENAKTTTPEGDEATGSADGQSGTEATEQKGSSARQVKSKD